MLELMASTIIGLTTGILINWLINALKVKNKSRKQI